MSSFLHLSQKLEKNEIEKEKLSSTKQKEINIKKSKLKDDLKYYSNVLEKEKILKDIEVNKLITDKKGTKKRKRRKKKNKYASVIHRYKTKRTIDNIKKRILLNKNRLNKSLSNLKFIKKSEIINLPKINIAQRKVPVLKSFEDLKFKGENKIFKLPTKKSDNKNKISNEKEIENNRDINLNLYQYMDNKNKNSRQNKRRNENNYIDYGDLGGYTFDDEIIMTESKNIDEFSEICNTMSNNLVTNDKNKAGLNMFLCGNNKYKDFKKRKVEELKHIIDDLKK
jgi:hypothetical protein